MAEPTSCIVCREAADDSTSSVCNVCGERFHLNQRNDRPGKDCGAVWIDDQYLALEFACQRCLDASGPAAPAEPSASGGRPRPRRRRYRKRS